MVNMSGSYPEDYRFDSGLCHHGDLAQKVEQLACNEKVIGSIPIVSNYQCAVLSLDVLTN